LKGAEVCVVRDIKIHFGNEEKSSAWAKEIQAQSVDHLRRLVAVLNTLPDASHDEASDALSALMKVLGDVIIAQAKALAGLKSEIPAVIDAVASFDAREKANKRIARDKDGKQAAKAAALKLWQEWQGNEHLHKSGAAFHRHVLAKLPAISDPKTVARWCKQWKAETGE
jgi:hypothetical protein